MFTVIAHYRAQAGKGDEIARVLAKHVAATRTEPGCAQFVVCRSADEPDRFVLYEQYVDEAAFDAHRNTPHFHRFVQQTVVPLLLERNWARYDEVEADSAVPEQGGMSPT